uniref:Capsid protein G8P n=1 Tax=Dulem virus 54 TaxID=3145765 RepID=A0AAU8B5L1_9VIRU
MKLMNVAKRHGAKLAVLGGGLSLAQIASAAIWDDAVTKLTELVDGVGAVGAVIITLAVTVVGFMFFKGMIKRTP